jgi:hypothetical protein
VSKYTLWVSIESIDLLNDGSVPGQRGPVAAAVVASLTYPRAGAPVVTSGHPFAPRVLKTVSGASDISVYRYEPPEPDFFTAGIFKEDVEESTILDIKVTDTSHVSKAQKIFLAIAESALGFGQAVIPYEMPILRGAVTNMGIGFLRTGLTAALGSDRVYVVGQAESLKLEMRDLPNRSAPRREAIGLVVPDEIHKPYQDATGSERELVLTKGMPNGEIILRIAAEPW